MPSLDDELIVLLDRLAERDATAMQALYRRTSKRLFGLALRIVREREAAEDALQDAYLQIWQLAATYRESLSPPMAWMGLIVKTRSLDQLRRRKARGEGFAVPLEDAREEDLLFESTGLQETAELSQQASIMALCLQRLAPNQRKVLAMAYWTELSHSDLARDLEQPLGTVKSWIRRGLEKLRECMDAGDRELGA